MFKDMSGCPLKLHERCSAKTFCFQTCLVAFAFRSGSRRMCKCIAGVLF